MPIPADPTSLRTHGAVPVAHADNSPAFAATLAALVAQGGGTLQVPDGVWGLGRTLVLPLGVSLILSPGATLRARPGFVGEALVELASYEGEHWTPQVVAGGILDGGAQPLVGIRTVRDRETEIRDLTVRNCLKKGIEIGLHSGCEVNLSHVRCQVEQGIIALPDSIGVHYVKCTDSLVHSVVVIGYATGVCSDSSSNDFQQVHVWNYLQNCHLKVCFACNGWNDSWNQCYADSPMNGDELGYGFHVTRPFNRITNGRIYNNAWATPDRVIGIFLGPGGTHGTFIGNHFTAQGGHRLAAAFAGNLDSACIVGNSYDPNVAAGRIAQLPSGGGGLSAMPVAAFSGVGLRLPVQPTIPTPTDGELGELRLCQSPGGSEALYVKTTSGWQRTQLTPAN